MDLAAVSVADSLRVLLTDHDSVPLAVPDDVKELREMLLWALVIPSAVNAKLAIG